ncbi:conserved membrane hypothetical protein [Desulfosarcina cetonica]|nr:conserved membrane hypothetical protein [Desulfosarcina cetonica]
MGKSFSTNWSELTLGDRSKANRLPYSVYYCLVVGLALIGLLDAIYLSISHYRVYTDTAYQSFCAISKAVNCDTVSQSPYSTLIGVPVPVWGVLGYACFIIIGFFAGQKQAEHKRLWASLQIIAVLFCLYSIVLALISTYWIHSYCIMCVVSYGVNLGLLFSVWIIRRRFDSTSWMIAIIADWHYLTRNRMRFALAVVMPIVVAAMVILWFPEYWELVPAHETNQVEKGIDEAGHPYFGSTEAEVTITEFADYQCFQCRKMHYFLRRLIEQYPDRARLIHRHFPMDYTVNPGLKTNLHVGSGKMALLAIYASAKDKFWLMNDLLFGMAASKKNFNLQQVAEKTGIDQRELVWALENKQVYQRLAMDLKKGGELGLEGTPGFLIEGNVYQGNIPSEVLQRIFNIK